MRKFDTKVQYLKYKVLREVANQAWNDTLLQNVFDIPKLIVPGKTSTMRCCVYKERAILAERVKMAMGGDLDNKNVIEVIDIACDECPAAGYDVTDSCRGCLAHRCEDVCKKGAISFDAAWGNEQTETLLKILEEKGVKCHSRKFCGTEVTTESAVAVCLKNISSYTEDGFKTIRYCVSVVSNFDADNYINKAFEYIDKELIQNIDSGAITDEVEIDKFVDDLYATRASGLKEGEYSEGNLIFKEIRNKGYLDNLKELRDKVVSDKLTLEELNEGLSRKDLERHRTEIQRLTFEQPIIQPNGLFELYNIKERDVQNILSVLRKQDFIDSVQASASRYDFNTFARSGIPSQLYRIYGQLK